MNSTITPSVIIPVLNNPNGLKRCIESILEQGVPVELIVVDNGSTDETVAVASRYSDQVLRIPDVTIGELRNQGARVSKGSVLIFTDSDQEPTADWLAAGLEAITAGERIGMVGARYHAPQGYGWVARVWDLQRRFSDVAGPIGWLEAGNLFIRREAFEDVGGFNSRLVASEDVDLSYRMRKAGWGVMCNPRLVNYHHGDPQTLLDFFRKERRRGASGWRAWKSHGCPISDLPGLLWPFWVVLGLVFLGGGGISAWVYGESKGNFYFWILFAIWLTPAILRAIRVCVRLSASVLDGIRLVLLLIIYGLARFPFPRLL